MNTIKQWALGIAIGFLLGGSILWGLGQRQKGANAILLQQERQRVDSIAGEVARRDTVIAKATAERDSIVRVLLVHRAADRVTGAKADTEAKTLASVRDSALAAAADTSATNAELRGEIHRLASESVRADSAYRKDRDALRLELSDANAIIRKDTIEIIPALKKQAKDLTRENDALAKQVTILTRSQATATGAVRYAGMGAAAVYLTCRFLVHCAP